MAHFAKLGLGNKVLAVHAVHNNELLVDGAENEQKGIDFLNNIHNTSDFWVQTSYNTHGGIHKLGGVPFRKNYSGKGYKYDKTRDAFIPPSPFPSWTLDEATCLWESPTPKPDGYYSWNESTQSWDVVS